MKKIIPKFEGIIDEYGKLHLKDSIRFKQHLMHLKGEVEVIVKKKSNRKSRSSQQNRYYFGIVLPIIAGWMGDTIESAHNALGMIFLIDASKQLKRIKSTTELSTVEFEDYMGNIRMYMAKEHDVFVPKPNEVLY